MFYPASKLTLLVLSLDRLYAVHRPLAYRRRRHDRAAIVSTVIVYGV